MDIYNECGTTPANTIGMGDPVAPTADSVGSEPLPTAKAKVEKVKRKKNMKDLKEYLNESILLGTAISLAGIYLIGSIVGYNLFANDEKANVKDAVSWLAKEYKNDWEEYKEDIEKFKNDPEVKKAIASGKSDIKKFRMLVSTRLSQGAQKFIEKAADKFHK